MNLWGVVAAFLGMTGILAGAMGAHVMRHAGLPPEALSWWSKAVLYQLLHVPVLLVLSTFVCPGRWLVLARKLMLTGVVLFSGSLYVLAMTQWKPMVWVTPVGGMMMVFGWAVLIVHFSKQPSKGAGDFST